MTSDATQRLNRSFPIDEFIRNFRLERRLLGTRFTSSVPPLKTVLTGSRMKSPTRSKLLQIGLLGIALVLAVSSNGQSAFTVGSRVDESIAENVQTSDLTGLNAAITEDLNTVNSFSPFTHFDFKLDPTGETVFEFANPGNSLELAFKTGKTLDHETMSNFIFRIISSRKVTSDTTKIANSLPIALRVTDVEERPQVLKPYDAVPGRVFYVQKNPDISAIPPLSAGQIFRDQDRNSGAMRFKACADDFKVDEYRIPGDDATSVPRGLVATDANESLTGNATHCFAAPTGDDPPDVNDVTRGGQVVNVTTTGPLIRISPVAAQTLPAFDGQF